MACANLGGLLLARGVAREHKLSIRLAIVAVAALLPARRAVHLDIAKALHQE